MWRTSYLIPRDRLKTTVAKDLLHVGLADSLHPTCLEIENFLTNCNYKHGQATANGKVLWNCGTSNGTAVMFKHTIYSPNQSLPL